MMSRGFWKEEGVWELRVWKKNDGLLNPSGLRRKMDIDDCEKLEINF